MNKSLDKLCIFLATGFGAGFLASGLHSFFRREASTRNTGAGFLGSCVGMVFVASGFPLSGFSGLLLLLVFTALSMAISGRAEKIFERKDDSRIVIDEIAGILWAFAFLPASAALWGSRLLFLAAGFALLRIFDVLKLPFRQAQNLQGGLGVVLDDVLAGLLANVVLQVAVRSSF